MAMPFAYPVALELGGRRCVVVGGGAEAERKARGLLEAGAVVTVVAHAFTSGLEDLARRRELSLVRRPYRKGDLKGVFLVVATGERAERAAVYAEAESRRVLCNAVDDVEHCHFAAPSVLRRGDLLVAISTGGRAPALAKRLRRQLADQLGWEYAVLVGLLGQIREEALVTRTVDFATWARRWQEALDGDLLDLVRQGRLDEARSVLRARLDGEPQEAWKAVTTSAQRSGSLR
jgi:siroheme synthase-like protein